MAGFFGIGDYTKEGPGISKNAPKKKTFFVFFETFFRNFWKFTTINIIYSLVCLPLITSGLANAGFTHIARNTARDKHSFGLSDFFETIKKNWKQSLLAGIINIVVFFVVGYAIFFYLTPENGTVSAIGLGISFAVLFCFIVMNFYIWTLIITFNLTLKQIYKNSFKFIFLNIKNNLLCAFCLLLVYAFYFSFFFIFGIKNSVIVFIIEFFIATITLPGFRFLLIQYFTFPSIKKFIIDPYYKMHPDADINLRRDLGLEVEEDNLSEVESSKD